MRSRYAAYSKGLATYILATTDPDGGQWRADRAAWTEEVAAFSAATRFEGLVILEAPLPVGDHGTVTFRAALTRDGQPVGFVEKSAFRRVNGHWLYVEGVPQENGSG